ncbi:DNA-directed RNA polymerase subunit M [Velocimicrobium porci]|uniref:DNA-directed RNA polymerase subunit M n=1 Tax=Velocimicrobium porci TaxID=2606634 RepID=A0A6L5Y100_9FIRM|nr:DNA-directed RNA polymerase subunit M [Velocimicrobium porci]MSS64830.1 DNA-directed RNA polymerase subunit M [Velocimicrobium porci]
MLKVYICPKCGAVRFVSKYKTQCFKCDCEMKLSKTSYEDYILLTESERQNEIEKVQIH